MRHYKVKRFSWVSDVWKGLKNNVRYWWHTPGEKDAIDHGEDPEKVKGFWANYKPTWAGLKRGILRYINPVAYAMRSHYKMKDHDARTRTGRFNEREYSYLGESLFANPQQQPNNNSVKQQQNMQMKQISNNLKQGNLQKNQQALQQRQQIETGRAQRAQQRLAQTAVKNNQRKDVLAKEHAKEGAKTVKTIELKKAQQASSNFKPTTEPIHPVKMKNFSIREKAEKMIKEEYGGDWY